MKILVKVFYNSLRVDRVGILEEVLAAHDLVYRP